jgi:isopenicillin-N epimerase
MSSVDQDVSKYRKYWNLAEGVTYLNHGSFGPTPLVVQEELARWTSLLASNPMNFYVRNLPDYLDEACQVLGDFVGTSGDNLVFADNATFAMNMVAASHYLKEGDEVLFTDHEYGSVLRLWRQKCKEVGASIVVRKLPNPLGSDEEIVETLFQAASKKTRLLVVSHVSSATAVILPVEKICQRARELKIPVCIDGPHAPVQVPLDIDKIGCTYYCASLHKWMSAPLGSGFLYVTPNQQQHMKPSIISWGRNMREDAPTWKDEYHWLGTRNPAPALAVPSAIKFITETIGLDTFRDYTQGLVASARQSYRLLTGLDYDLGLDPIPTHKPELAGQHRYGSMITLPMPDFVPNPDAQTGLHPLRVFLWDRYQIECLLPRWQDKLYLRISCHLYTSPADLDRLMTALAEYFETCRP